MSITWLTNAGSLAEPEQLAWTDGEQWDAKKLSAKVALKCPWADRYNVLDNILSYHKEWPYLPGANIRAVSGSIGPFGQSKPTTSGSGIDYVDAVVNVNFEWAHEKPDGPDGNPAVYSESFEPSAEFLTIPYQDFRWGSATGTPLKKEEAPGRLEIGLDYTITWNSLRSIPAQALTLIGAVNRGTAASPSYGLQFPEGTLLFNPPKISRSVSLGPNASNYFQMVIRLTYRANGWNNFWRANTGTWESIYKSEKAGGGLYNNFRVETFGKILP